MTNIMQSDDRTNDLISVPKKKRKTNTIQVLSVQEQTNDNNHEQYYNRILTDYYKSSTKNSGVNVYDFHSSLY